MDGKKGKQEANLYAFKGFKCMCDRMLRGLERWIFLIINQNERTQQTLKEFRMNTNNRQKFMTLFNDLLSDRQGSAQLEKVLKLTEKGDEVDNLSTQREQALNMRLDQRNILFLKKVEQAKQKILDGVYGECEDCSSEISQRRLQARPTASLCINCQEEKERSEFSNIKKRRDLNTKKFKENESEFDHILERPKFNQVSDIAFESVVDF